MTHGLAQTPFVRHLSHSHGGPGKAQTVPPKPALAPPARVSVPAAAPASAPNATAAARPKKPRLVVLRATPSLTRRQNAIACLLLASTPSALSSLQRLRRCDRSARRPGRSPCAPYRAASRGARGCWPGLSP